MDNFSLTRHVRHRTIGSWELASRSTEEGWGNALSGARPVDTAPTQLGKTSRTKNLITECIADEERVVLDGLIEDRGQIVNERVWQATAPQKDQGEWPGARKGAMGKGA